MGIQTHEVRSRIREFPFNSLHFIFSDDISMRSNCSAEIVVPATIEYALATNQQNQIQNSHGNADSSIAHVPLDILFVYSRLVSCSLRSHIRGS